MTNNLNVFQIMLLLLCSLSGILGIVLFFKMILHCHKTYHRNWLKIIHPLHELAFIPTLVGMFGIDYLTKLTPELAQKIEKALPFFIFLSVVAIIHRLFRHTSYISVWTNMGCLIIEIVFAFCVLLCVFALYAIILIIGAIILIFAFSADTIFNGSSGNSNDGCQNHYLRQGGSGLSDLIPVYSVNGNMHFLHGYDGTRYTKLNVEYISDDPNDEKFYYIFRGL